MPLLLHLFSFHNFFDNKQLKKYNLFSFLLPYIKSLKRALTANLKKIAETEVKRNIKRKE